MPKIKIKARVIAGWTERNSMESDGTYKITATGVHHEQMPAFIGAAPARLSALEAIREAASANSFEIQLKAGNLSELVSEIFTLADSAIKEGSEVPK